MIPGVDLIDFIKYVGVFGVALVIFAESGLLIGFFLPGDSLLFTAGFLTYAGLLPINIHILVPILFLAAVLGDSTGYTFGRRIGYKLFARPNSRFFKQEYLLKANAFYEKHGGKTIILARFIPVVRTFAPIVAGAAKMNYRKFLAFNITGAILWAAGVTYAGYYIGAWLESIGIHIDQVLLPIVTLIILTSVLPPIVHIFKDKKQRDAFLDATRRQIRVLLKKK